MFYYVNCLPISEFYHDDFQLGIPQIAVCTMDERTKVERYGLKVPSQKSTTDPRTIVPIIRARRKSKTASEPRKKRTPFRQTEHGGTGFSLIAGGVGNAGTLGCVHIWPGAGWHSRRGGPDGGGGHLLRLRCRFRLSGLFLQRRPDRLL